jgi:hypothetical protein
VRVSAIFANQFCLGIEAERMARLLAKQILSIQERPK